MIVTFIVYSFEPWSAVSFKTIVWSPRRENSVNGAFIVRNEPLNETNFKAVIYLAVIPFLSLEAGL